MDGEKNISAKVLGQISVMESMVMQLPDKENTLRFVCRGLKDIPGVNEVDYTLFDENHSTKPGTIDKVFYIKQNKHEYASLLFQLSDKEEFSPYIPYIDNFCNMLAVIFKEHQQRKLNEALMADLELRVSERTKKLEAEIKSRIQVEEELKAANQQLQATEQQLRAANQQLEASEHQLRNVIENTKNVFYSHTTEHQITYISPQIEDILGYTPEEAIIKWTDLVSDNPINETGYNYTVKAIETGKRQPIHELELVRKDGKKIFVEVNESPLVKNGQTIAIVGSLADITERKLATEALKESEYKFRSYIENAPDAIFVVNEYRNYIEVNKAACKITGYSEDELLKLSIPDLIQEEYQEKSAKHFQTVVNKGFASVETAFITKSGEKRFWRVDAVKLSETRFIGFAQDITERKRTETELIKLLTAVEQSSSAIIITDTEGTIEYVNSAFETLTGYSNSEVLGKTPKILKSGKQSDEFYKDLWSTISGGNTWEGKIINCKKDGSFYTEDASISPVFTKKGNITNYVAVKKDITREEDLQEQLKQSQKMESIGRLAGGVAHDFNNILTVILNYCELALMDLDSSNELTGYIKEIKKAGERSSEITSQLLAFARKQHNHPKVMNLNDSINDMIGMLQRLIGENIGLVWLPAENICPIKMDSSQLHQILANLCINARDAIGDSGKITIETSCVSIDENYAGKNPDFLPGEFVMLAVSDNGCGMDKSTVENIFEPFFTTKGAGEGTGLGLSTVYGIVKQNGGFVNVYSEIGKGTTFKIYLKCESEEAEKAEEEQKAVPTESKGETVLIVEDEEAILHISEKMLETLGYNLLTANNPLDAIKIAKDYNGNIDIIVTDVVMPDMNGKEMSEKITKLHPNAKVLFISGYTFNVIGQHGLFEENVNFIQKPFNVREFRSKIREILDEK